MRKLISLLNTALIFAAGFSIEYCYNIFGLKTYFSDSVWPWIVMATVGTIGSWVYNMHALQITGWILGRSDELE